MISFLFSNFSLRLFIWTAPICTENCTLCTIYPSEVHKNNNNNHKAQTIRKQYTPYQGKSTIVKPSMAMSYEWMCAYAFTFKFVNFIRTKKETLFNSKCDLKVCLCVVMLNLSLCRNRYRYVCIETSLYRKQAWNLRALDFLQFKSQNLPALPSK